MDNVESSMEQAIQDAGFSISDTPPTQDAQPTQEAQPQAVQQPQAVEPQQTTAPEPSAPVEQPVQQQEVQQEAQPVQETAEPVQSSLDTESAALESFFSGLSETQEPVTEPDNAEQISAQDLDPRIQVIADFVAKTGRSPEDWFRYQSLDPSEMYDRTVMRVYMAS